MPKYTILTCLGTIVESEYVEYTVNKGAITWEVIRVGREYYTRDTTIEDRPVGLSYPTPCVILGEVSE